MNLRASQIPVDDENRPFWEGAKRHEVVMQRCTACGRFRFPASGYCASCRSDQSSWVRLSGRGVIESHCIFHKAYFEAFASRVPYNVALVALEEGPKLFTNIVGIANSELRIGQAVSPVFEQITPELVLLKFEVIMQEPARALSWERL